MLIIDRKQCSSPVSPLLDVQNLSGPRPTWAKPSEGQAGGADLGFSVRCFFVLARSQVIYYVLNIGVFHPYQHVKHYNIDYAARRNIECFWSSICSHWYSYLASFSSSSCLVLSRVPAWLVLTYCSNSFSRSVLTTIVAGKNLEFRYLQVMLIDNIRFIIPTP